MPVGHYKCGNCGKEIRAGISKVELSIIADELGVPGYTEAYDDESDLWRKRNILLEKAKTIYYEKPPDILRGLPDTCPFCGADRKKFIEKEHICFYGD